MLPVTDYTRTALCLTAALITSFKKQTLALKLQVGFNKSVRLWKGLKSNFSGCKLQMSKCALFSATLSKILKTLQTTKGDRGCPQKKSGGRGGGSASWTHHPTIPPSHTHKHTKGNMLSCKLGPVKCLLGLKELLWTGSDSLTAVECPTSPGLGCLYSNKDQKDLPSWYPREHITITAALHQYCWASLSVLMLDLFVMCSSPKGLWHPGLKLINVMNNQWTRMCF